MISLDQVQSLEARVEKAIAAIARLTSENAALRESAAREQKRAADLERTIEEYRRDQTRIEQGILHALERLNAFEDAIQDPAAAAHPRTDKPSRPGTAAAQPAPAVPKPDAASRAAEPSRPEPASSAKDGTDPAPGADEAELEIF